MLYIKKYYSSSLRLESWNEGDKRSVNLRTFLLSPVVNHLHDSSMPLPCLYR